MSARRHRVLLVTHYMPPHLGGIERVGAWLAGGMARRGHEVRWIASATPLGPGRSGEHVRVRTWNVLEERLGVPYPLWSPRAAAQVGALVRWADVVHAHDCLYPGSLLAALACRASRTPLLLTQHVGYVPFGPTLDRAQRLAYATLGRGVLASADEVVGLSTHVERWFASLGVRRAFRRIPNAVDTARFHPRPLSERRAFREVWGLPHDARVLLFVGRLVPRKGVAQVIELQRRLAAEGTRLLVAGGGPLATELHGVPGLVHLPSDRVPHARMHELYALADVFVLPSRGEGLPLSLQEALASGLPAVVSDDPAFVEHVGDAPGVTLAADLETALAALRRVLEAPPDRELVARAAHERWGGDRLLHAYEAVYDELVARRA